MTRPAFCSKTFNWTVVVCCLFAFSLFSCTAGRKSVTEKDVLAAKSYYKLALDYYSNNNTIETLKALEEADKYDPYNPEVKNLYGLIFLGKKMHLKAEENFKAAIEADPKFSDASVGLASVYMDQGHWQKALDALKKPSEDLLYQRKDVVYDNMGWCYHKLGENKKAIEHLYHATSENAKNCHAWYNLGLVYKSEAQYTDAIKALKKSVEYCKTFLYGYYELAMVAIKARDNAIAKPALEKCVTLGKDGIEAGECRNYLRLLKD